MKVQDGREEKKRIHERNVQYWRFLDMASKPLLYHDTESIFVTIKLHELILLIRNLRRFKFVVPRMLPFNATSRSNYHNTTY